MGLRLPGLQETGHPCGCPTQPTIEVWLCSAHKKTANAVYAPVRIPGSQSRPQILLRRGKDTVWRHGAQEETLVQKWIDVLTAQNVAVKINLSRFTQAANQHIAQPCRPVGQERA